MASALETWLGLLRSPRVTLARVASRGEVGDGLIPVLTLGVLYAAFVLLLYLRGHAPSVTLVPIARDHYYLWEALFVAPLFIALWLVYGGLAHALCRLARGAGTLRATLAVIGLAYAVPLIALFVVPDLLVFLTLGHGALGKAMRFYAPASAFACVALSALGLREAHGLRAGRAIAVALVGFMVQGALGGVLLR